MIGLALISFFSGFFMEALFVLWVHYAERNHRMRTFLLSLALGATNVAGLGTAISNWWCGTAFVIGYAIGAIVGLELKRMIPHTPGSVDQTLTDRGRTT